MAEEFILLRCPHCNSERTVFPEDPALLECYHCGRSYSQVSKPSGQDTGTPPAVPNTAFKVMTTDDTLHVYRERDLSSAVMCRVSKGIDIWLNAAIEFEGREWMQSTVGTDVGYVLASSARGHTTLLEAQTRPIPPAGRTFRVSLVVGSQGKIKFPKTCPCCGGDPLDSTLLIRGSWNPGVFSAAMIREVAVPYCSACKAHISAVDIKYMVAKLTKQESKRASCVSYDLAVEMRVDDYISTTFTFASGSYGEMFRLANASMVEAAAAY